jgi:hypothetical protein
MNASPTHEDWIWWSLSGALARTKLRDGKMGPQCAFEYSATRTIVYLWIAMSLASVFAQAQQNASRGSLLDHSSESPQQAKKKEKRGSIVAVPIPISSPAIGSGVVLAGGYIFSLRNSDTVSQPSTVGAAVLITDNGSRAWGLGGEFYAQKNTYHIMTIYFRATSTITSMASGPSPVTQVTNYP